MQINIDFKNIENNPTKTTQEKSLDFYLFAILHFYIIKYVYLYIELKLAHIIICFFSLFLVPFLISIINKISTTTTTNSSSSNNNRSWGWNRNRGCCKSKKNENEAKQQ